MDTMNIQFTCLAFCLALPLVASAADTPAAAPKASAPHAAMGPKARQAVPAKPAASKPVRLMDLNTATKAQLKTLPTITDADADKIIAGRPYTSKADLATRPILLRGQYESVKSLVMALPPAKARAKAGPSPKASSPGSKP